jgi:hypothetical protein
MIMSEKKNLHSPSQSPYEFENILAPTSYLFFCQQKYNIRCKLTLSSNDDKRIDRLLKIPTMPCQCHSLQF